MGFDIGYIQLDNHSEVDPIFPVVLKPKYKREYDFKKIEVLQPQNDQQTF